MTPGRADFIWTKKKMITGNLAEQLLDAVPDAVLVVRSDGIITAVNSTVFVVFGWLPEELVGQNVDVLVPPHDHDKHHSGFDEYFVRGPTSRELHERSALIGKRKDGGDAIVHIALIPLGIDQQTGLMLAGAICRDTRDRIAAMHTATGMQLSALKDMRETRGSDVR